MPLKMIGRAALKRRSGKRSRIVETVRWERDWRATPTPAYKAKALDVFVRTPLPADTPVTRSIGPEDDDRWFLDASATVPGIDYAVSVRTTDVRSCCARQGLASETAARPARCRGLPPAPRRPPAVALTALD